jgi:hypothetical protein
MRKGDDVKLLVKKLKGAVPPVLRLISHWKPPSQSGTLTLFLLTRSARCRLSYTVEDKSFAESIRSDCVLPARRRSVTSAGL